MHHQLPDLIEEIGEEALRDYSDELYDLAKGALAKKKKFTWEEVKAFFKRGNDYNTKVKSLRPNPYQYHEVSVVKQMPNGELKAFRLDSYNPGKAIVSRKATDFDKIQISTFEKYLNEFKNKYTVGTPITAKGLKGQVLSGEYKIEVPLTNEISSKRKEFEELAKKYSVEIIYRAE
jgi:hypothetical protein